MTNHIPPEHLLPQDMVDIFDHGPEESRFEAPVKMRMHSTEAKHAMSVEPKRYMLTDAPKEAAATEEDHDV